MWKLYNFPYVLKQNLVISKKLNDEQINSPKSFRLSQINILDGAWPEILPALDLQMIEKIPVSAYIITLNESEKIG